MYLKKVHIQNIKSIQDFEMEFEEPAGWHVLIGDNGAGKSTIVQAISLGFLGNLDARALGKPWSYFLNRTASEGYVELDVIPSKEDWDTKPVGEVWMVESMNGTVKFLREKGEVSMGTSTKSSALFMNLKKGWFSAAFGPFRRFRGAEARWDNYFELSRVAGHISAFQEGAVFFEALEWLKQLNYQLLEKRPDSYQLECIQSLINSSGSLKESN
jgi:energy-coupling factor transporter ATP-binding protein EcfA2